MDNNGNYIETGALRTRDCDLHGCWRAGAILEAMQETASEHCRRLGIGRDETDALGVAWVLSRTRVEFSRLPRLGETVSVETWPTARRHLFYPRMNLFRDGAGEAIGRAASLWVLIDIGTRRIVNHERVESSLPPNRDREAPVGLPTTVRAPEAEPVVQALTPVYGDFDVNGHVNNTRYMDWCLNALGMEALREEAVVAFDVNYESEILPGEQIETRLWRDGERFVFAGSRDAHRCFAVEGRLAPR